MVKKDVMMSEDCRLATGAVNKPLASTGTTDRKLTLSVFVKAERPQKVPR
jgi:hypothetical protein